MNGAIYALRIKLSDFIETPLEEMVIDSINAANVHHTFTPFLSHNSGLSLKSHHLQFFFEGCLV